MAALELSPRTRAILLRFKGRARPDLDPYDPPVQELVSLGMIEPIGLITFLGGGRSFYTFRLTRDASKAMPAAFFARLTRNP
jgi:hypothetical protein